MFANGKNFRRAIRPSIAVAVVAAFATATAPASAQMGTGAVVGVVTNSEGSVIPGAVVTLSGNGVDRKAVTNEHGVFGISGVYGGTYTVRAAAKGYNPVSGRTLDVAPGGAARLTLALERSATSLTTIGQVRANGRQTVSTSSAPSVQVNSQAYADVGYTRVSDMLDNEISTTLMHPVGGSPALPTAVALRGPDPTETLVALDGHAVNGGSAGDFDLSLLDPADYAGVQLIYGISPSSLVGPNTIDGAINIQTLEPTSASHGLLRLSTGSFGSFGATLQTTGTSNKLGYAFSLHRTTTQGEVNQAVTDAATGDQQFVGSSVDGTTALGKVRYSLGRSGAYAGFTFHDQSFDKDLSAALSSIPAPGGSPAPAGAPILVNSFAGTTLQAHNAAYGFDLQEPLGRLDASGIPRTTALLRWQSSLASQSVFGPGANTSPYLNNQRDLIGDGVLQIDHSLPKGLLTLQFDLRNEQLQTTFTSGVVNDQSTLRKPFSTVADAQQASATPSSSIIDLGQTQRSAVLRYAFDPTSKLHYTLAAYYSSFSTFGSSLDPRAGFVWTPNADSALRMSVGSTFQAPQLPELYVPPVLPPPVNGYISTGNPHLGADHATDFDVGYERFVGEGPERTHLSVDIYRTNLRQPASTYYPVPSTNPDCNPSSGSDGVARSPRAIVNGAPCPLSFPVNAGDGVYRGIEVRADRQVAPYTTVRAGYSVNSAYLTSVPPYIQDGTLVVGEQTLGLPLQKGIFSIDHQPPAGLQYGVGLIYQGPYNGLNQPKYALLNASLGYRLHQFELNLAGTNLTNVYNSKFTVLNGGVPYAGVDGPIPTNAYALQGRAFTLTLTRRY